jgi:hypothetical protein
VSSYGAGLYGRNFYGVLSYSSATTTRIKTWVGLAERVYTLPVVPATQEDAWILDTFASAYNLTKS